MDDTARLATTGAQIEATLTSQPMTGNAALGTAPMYVEYTSSYTVDPGGSITNFNERVPRHSSHVDLGLVRNGMDLARLMGRLVATAAMNSAEGKWTHGYCVEITVPEMEGTMYVDDPRGPETMPQLDVPSRRVDVGTELPFTGVVTHKFEGGQLHVPVTATLTSGMVSVTPSGTRVPAPAPFRYKAPDEPCKNAVVTLETRSRRGVATLIVGFRSFPPGWVYAPGSTMADGKYCYPSVGGDWVVNIHSTTGGVTLTGAYVVTIDETTLSGTYVYDLRQTGPGGSGSWHGTGRASIVLQPDKNVAMSFHGGTTRITIKASGGTSSTTVPGPEGQQFLWQPATTECR